MRWGEADHRPCRGLRQPTLIARLTEVRVLHGERRYRGCTYSGHHSVIAFLSLLTVMASRVCSIRWQLAQTVTRSARDVVFLALGDPSGTR